MVSHIISPPSLHISSLTYVGILAQPPLSAFSGIVVVQPIWCRAYSKHLSPLMMLEHLADCLERFIPSCRHYKQASYNAAQPVTSQWAAWLSIVPLLLDVDRSCSSIWVPHSLEGLYDVVTFTEATEASFCVFYEPTIDCHMFKKEWGAMIMPEQQVAVSHTIHISAPCPGFDVGTPSQAVYLLQATGTKSFFVAEWTCTVFLHPSLCTSVISQSGYYKTDPTQQCAIYSRFHKALLLIGLQLEPFFDASLAIYSWQQQRGCFSSTCTYIQMHGKGSSMCPLDQVFISAELGMSSMLFHNW